jgi:hypothetical protein
VLQATARRSRAKCLETAIKRKQTASTWASCGIKKDLGGYQQRWRQGEEGKGMIARSGLIPQTGLAPSDQSRAEREPNNAGTSSIPPGSSGLLCLSSLLSPTHASWVCVMSARGAMEELTAPRPQRRGGHPCTRGGRQSGQARHPSVRRHCPTTADAANSEVRREVERTGTLRQPVTTCWLKRVVSFAEAVGKSRVGA